MRGTDANPAAALEAAHIAVHMLAEGYYGAAPTLSPRRAAALAVTSANAWMFSQANVASASLAALIFAGRRVGVLHVGDCRVHRLRRGQLMPLSEDHLRPLPDGKLSRKIGGNAELHVDYIEDTPELSDRYFLISREADAGIVDVAERFFSSAGPKACRGTAPPMAGTAVVADVLQLPQESFDELSASMLRLPLRRPPREGDNWDGFVLGRTFTPVAIPP